MIGLTLDKKEKVTSGGQRDVYLHPYDSTKLVKVLKPQQDIPRRYNFNGLATRFFPSTRIRQIRKEYQEYLRVCLNHPAPDFNAPFSHMHGFVVTNLGLGCLTERVIAPDGTLGKTLGEKVRTGDFTDADLELLNNCIGRIYDYEIRASDLNANNFVFGCRSNVHTHGPVECVLVDGIGDIHAIPIRSMARWSNRLGLNDSCARLARKTHLHWDSRLRKLARPTLSTPPRAWLRDGHTPLGAPDA
jgi:hypothetical protein